MSWTRPSLIEAARAAATHAYAPYSNYHVGAALGFADGRVITGANIENASYGLSLCAETIAVGQALSQQWAGWLEMVAVIGGPAGLVGQGEPVTPCGRCRQLLHEVAARGKSDPLILCVGRDLVLDLKLSTLLPLAFGPENLR